MPSSPTTLTKSLYRIFSSCLSGSKFASVKVNLIFFHWSIHREVDKIKTDNINCDGSPKDGLNTYLGTSTDFTFDLSEPMNNVISMTTF